jgi:hypothetical protein
MKIVQVEYRRLRTFGSYENETVGATAQVGEEETPEQAIETVRQWVDSILGDAEERSGLSERVSQLRWDERNLKSRIERMQIKWGEIMAFLARFGIERPADVPGDLAEILSPEPTEEPDEELKGLPF